MNNIPQIMFAILFVAVDIAFVSAAGERPFADSMTMRETAAGPVIGFSDTAKKSYSWLGIPYAKPPIGALRWRAPRPVEDWEDVRTVLEMGAYCSQSKTNWRGGITTRDAFESNTYVGSEDCLYLNVWSPAFNAKASETTIVAENKKATPVMVWIHGGGNIRGSGYIDGAKLAGTQNVVVVSMNYRLGTFGWLSHPALKEDNSTLEDSSGNYGTLDIIQALKWVKNNIADFGGDPNNITIFGVSAGGTNIYSLLVSPLAKDLFHRAIIQSGIPMMVSVEKAENFMDDLESGHPQSSSELLLQLLQIDAGINNRAWAKTQLKKMRNKTIAEYLRSKTYEQLEEAYATLATRHAKKYLDREEVSSIKLKDYIPKANSAVPRIFNDGFVVPKTNFNDSIGRDDGYNAVPIILGSSRDESTAFQKYDSDFTTISNGKYVIKNIQRYNLTNEYVSMLWKAIGVDEPVIAISKSYDAPIFAYRMDWDSLTTTYTDEKSLDKMLGATHGMISKITFFGIDKSKYTDQSIAEINELSDSIMSYWAEFAYNGSPNRGRNNQLTLWKPWSNEKNSEKIMILDSTSDKGIRMSKEKITRASVLESIASDPRLETRGARCRLYKDILVQPFTFLTLSEYNKMENGFCAQYYSAVR